MANPLEELAPRMDALRAALATIIVGQEEAVDQLLAALLAGGHVLLEGVPGVAKTLLARSLAQALGLDFGRVQFTPDLMPADIVGSSLFDFQDRSFRLQKGPVFTQVLLADEINRTPPKTQAALLEAMEERQATIDGTTHLLPSPFFVIATQNPIDHEGTYPLPEAQLDRFLLKVVLDYPSPDEELEIYGRFVAGRLSLGRSPVALEPVFGSGEVEQTQQLLGAVQVEPPVLAYLRDLVATTRRSPLVAAGASPRAGLAWLAVARARAAMQGRDFVIPDDLKALAGPVLRHRLLLTAEAELEGRTADDVLTGLIASVDAPMRLAWVPTRRAFALLGAASLLGLFAFAVPWLVLVMVAFDVVILGLVLVDGRRAARAPLELERVLPSAFHQGERAAVRIELRTTLPRPSRLWLREILCPQLTEEPRDLHLDLPARGHLVVELAVTPRLRGAASLAPAAVRVEGPWRLAWHTRELATDDRVRVFPRLHLERDAGLLLKRIMSSRMGANPISARGLSTELYALREYRPGDALSSLHWKASARHNRPITRELAWEQHQHTLVLLDCGRPMAGLALHGQETPLSKLDHALSAVVGLLRAIVAQKDEATVVLFSKEVRAWVRIDRRTRSFREVFERVHDIQADLDEPDYDGVAAWCARRLPRRSLAVVVTSVVDLAVAEPLGHGLLALARRHRPLLVDLRDPDLESAARAVPDDVRGAYRKTTAMGLLEANAALSARLRGEGIDTLSVPADRLAFGMLQKYLDLKSRRRI